MDERQIIPGVQIVRRTLPIYFLVDISTSMIGAKLDAVNQAIPAAVHAVQQAMQQHPEVLIKIHAMTIGTTAEWHVGPEGVPIDEFHWVDLVGGGKTMTGQGINMLCDVLNAEKMDRRGYPPVCILISDGYHSDKEEFYEAVIARLNKVPWGRKAVRLAIALGPEEYYDAAALSKFGNQDTCKLIKVEDYKEILKYIRWATVAVSLSSTNSKSQIGDSNTGNVYLPPPPKGVDLW